MDDDSIGVLILVLLLFSSLLVIKACVQDGNEFQLEKLRIERACPKTTEAK